MEGIVIGGGMGGLAAAMALRQCGAFASVDVYEQNDSPTTAGAGITIQPNGARVCRALGVDLRGPVGKAAVLTGARAWKRDNKTLLHKELDQEGYGDGAGFHHMHRADLLACLHDRASQLAPRLRVHMGKRLVSLRQDWPSPGRVTVGFADGSDAAGDVVIGADGIHSKVLALQWPRTPPPRWTEVTCFRGLIPRAKVAELDLDHPAAGSLTADTRAVPRGICFTYWVRRGELLNVWVGLHEPDSAPFEGSEGDHYPVSHAEMQRRAAAVFGGDLRCRDVLTLLGAMERPTMWGLYDGDSLEEWHDGRVALLGDAAHSMLPTMGQGVNQALEDAAALGACFVRWGTDVARALLHYERVRHFRAGRFQYASKFIFKHLAPPDSANRDRLLATVDERDVTAWNLSKRAAEGDAWIYAFDAADVGAELPLRKLGPWDFRARHPIKGEILRNLWRPPARRGGAPPPARVTRADVARHSTLRDSWVIVRGRVYDFSEWNEHHPGGAFVSKLYAGKDATAEFGDFHSAAARAHMRHFLIADLVDGGDAAPPAPRL